MAVESVGSDGASNEVRRNKLTTLERTARQVLNNAMLMRFKNRKQ
jgi:hypothetical protein